MKYCTWEAILAPLVVSSENNTDSKNKYFSRLLLALQSASHNGSCSVKAWLVIGPVVYDLPHRRSVWCVGYSGLGVLWDTWYRRFSLAPARAFVDCEWGMKSMREMSGSMNSQERHKATRRTFMCATVIWSNIIRLRKKIACRAYQNLHLKKRCHTVNLITKSMHTLKFLHGCLKKPQYYTQWWSVTKYNYFVTVLKYIFQVSVLYWSSFILSNFYFYFTTFQSIRSYFLLHYIS